MKSYNLCLSVECTPSQYQCLIPNSSNLLFYSHSNESSQNVKMAAWLCSLSTMGCEPVYIGLKWIEMVEILVGEVDRRSTKEVFWAQLTQMNRGKAWHKSFYLEALWSFLFSLFTKGTTPPLWKAVLGKPTLQIKSKGGATPCIQHNSGGAEEGTTPKLKG